MNRRVLHLASLVAVAIPLCGVAGAEDLYCSVPVVQLNITQGKLPRCTG